MPTVRPLADRFPGLFDEAGCLILAPAGGDVDCGVAPPLPDVPEASHNPDAEKRLLGFLGPFYLEDPGDEGVVVLASSVAEATDGPWSATGLIRNESTRSVGHTTVTGHLLAADGSEVATVSSGSVLRHIRPGEPAPFHIESDIDASLVAEVVWELSSEPPSEGDAVRALELSVFWEQPYGDRERLESVIPPDPSSPPFPYVVAGGVVNAAAVTIADPIVVLGWLDPEGRLSLLETTPVRQFTLSDVGIDELAPDEGSGFLVQVSDATLGPAISSGQGSLVLWAAGE
jgi:hypothetical protein